MNAKQNKNTKKRVVLEFKKEKKKEEVVDGENPREKFWDVHEAWGKEELFFSLILFVVMCTFALCIYLMASLWNSKLYSSVIYHLPLLTSC